MTLPTGQISTSEVNTEMGRTSTASLNLDDTAVRYLAGKPSGMISMDDLRGKTYAATISAATQTNGSAGSYTGYAAVDTLAPFGTLPTTTVGSINDLDIPSIPSETTNNMQVTAACWNVGPFSGTPAFFLATTDTVSGSPYPETGWTTMYLVFAGPIVHSIARTSATSTVQCSVLQLSGCDVRWQFDNLSTIYADYTNGDDFDIYFK